MATTIAGTTIMVAAALLVAMVAAQSPAAAPVAAAPGEVAAAPGPAALDCLSYLANTSDCLTYVEAGSNLTKPDKGCCPELAGLVESQPICLCALLGNTGATLGIEIQLNKALNLPSVCGVTTPPLALCAVAGYPVPGPMSSEVPSSAPGGGGGMAPAGLASSPAAASSGNSGSGASSVSQLAALGIAFLTTLFFSSFHI